jgi:hypothetical protein
MADLRFAVPRSVVGRSAMRKAFSNSDDPRVNVGSSVSLSAKAQG